MGLPGGSVLKNPPAVQDTKETEAQSLGREDLLEDMAWQPTPVFLPGESHRQRSLARYSPWDPKELDTPEQLSTQNSVRERGGVGQVQGAEIFMDLTLDVNVSFSFL